MMLRPAQWLFHLPVVLLPLAAALLMEVASMAWLAVALGLGLWVGWHNAIDRPFHRDPEE